jgi:hypothetical protein
LKSGKRITSELVLVETSEGTSRHRLFSENSFAKAVAPPERPLVMLCGILSQGGC